MPSKKSSPVYVFNVPEIKSLSGKFVYNYHTADERVTQIDRTAPPFSLLGINKLPRYIALQWFKPSTSNNLNDAPSFDIPDAESPEDVQQILNNITSEDSSFSSLYLNKDFSNTTKLSQGALDLQYYLDYVEQERVRSVNQTKDKILEALVMAEGGAITNTALQNYFKEIAAAYDGLSDISASLLGFSIYDKDNQLTDDNNFLRSVSQSLTLNTKIHKLAIKDFFTNLEIEEHELDTYKSYESFGKIFAPNGQKIANVKAINLQGTTLTGLPNITLKGYLIRRYRVNQENKKLNLENVIFIKNPAYQTYNDPEVLYGENYVYTISVIAKVPFQSPDLLSPNQNSYVVYAFLESRPALLQIECFEYKPPPPPTEINFVFDYVKNNLMIYWDFPVNPQHDIKQFQIFRRKSLDEPFELIQQYGFDDTSPAVGGKKYVTKESVDANNIESMNPDLKPLVAKVDGPIYNYIDKDFIVDREFFESTSFIYALCSVDAHGMISNYSSQYRVSFDSFRNKIISRLVCDEGSPRAYPNMNLRLDGFKDSINTTGEDLKNVQVYFTPDYLNVQDEEGKKFKIIEAEDPNDTVKPYYLMQIMNLDNQIVKTVKINVSDPESLSKT